MEAAPEAAGQDAGQPKGDEHSGCPRSGDEGVRRGRRHGEAERQEPDADEQEADVAGDDRPRVRVPHARHEQRAHDGGGDGGEEHSAHAEQLPHDDLPEAHRRREEQLKGARALLLGEGPLGEEGGEQPQGDEQGGEPQIEAGLVAAEVEHQQGAGERCEGGRAPDAEGGHIGSAQVACGDGDCLSHYLR